MVFCIGTEAVTERSFILSQKLQPSAGATDAALLSILEFYCNFTVKISLLSKQLQTSKQENLEKKKGAECSLRCFQRHAEYIPMVNIPVRDNIKHGDILF